MSENMESSNWKLELRYGRLVTPYTHFTAIADGVVGELRDGFECRPGPAFMSMKTWAADADDSADMARLIGQQLGFSVTGKIEVYTTEAEQPPGDRPSGYNIGFIPYDED